MSLRSIPATGLENVRPGSTPCLGVGATITDSKQYEQVRCTAHDLPPLHLALTVTERSKLERDSGDRVPRDSPFQSYLNVSATTFIPVSVAIVPALLIDLGSATTTGHAG